MYTLRAVLTRDRMYSFHRRVIGDAPRFDAICAAYVLNIRTPRACVDDLTSISIYMQKRNVIHPKSLTYVRRKCIFVPATRMQTRVHARTPKPTHTSFTFDGRAGATDHTHELPSGVFRRGAALDCVRSMRFVVVCCRVGAPPSVGGRIKWY